MLEEIIQTTALVTAITGALLIPSHNRIWRGVAGILWSYSNLAWMVYTALNGEYIMFTQYAFFLITSIVLAARNL